MPAELPMSPWPWTFMRAHAVPCLSSLPPMPSPLSHVRPQTLNRALGSQGAAAVPSKSPATEDVPEQMDDANLTASPCCSSPPKESTRDAMERPCRPSFPASVRPTAAAHRASSRHRPATPASADPSNTLRVSSPCSPSSLYSPSPSRLSWRRRPNRDAAVARRRGTSRRPVGPWRRHRLPCDAPHGVPSFPAPTRA